MRLSALLEILGCRVISFGGDLSLEVSGATADSRQVRAGMLFCAMQGAKMDGHDFIPAALANGASAVLIVHPCDLPANIPWLQVVEPYPVFGLVAEAFAGKPSDAMDVLAVTGTNGKTTTAYLLRAIWKHAGIKTGMIGTVEYDVCAPDGGVIEADRTTPTPFQLQERLSELRANGASAVAMEVSSHALEQRRLGTTRCAAAIFTNLTQDHLDYHLTMEGYYQAKKLLFTDFLREGAPIVLNCDDQWGARLASELSSAANICSYSFEHDAAYRFRLVESSAQKSVILLEHAGVNFTFETPLIGRYNAYNVAGAITCALACGIRDGLAEVVASFAGAPGRLERVSPIGNPYSVFVDYAHTDDALLNVLGTLHALKRDGQRLIAVFGCGGDRDRKKRPLMAKAAARFADSIFVTSDNPRTEKPEDIISEIVSGMPSGTDFRVVVDRREAIASAIDGAGDGDIVLLAGKGHETYQEINGIKHPFDDRVVARECIARQSHITCSGTAERK